MNRQQTKDDLLIVLKAFEVNLFSNSAQELLKVLGYESHRVLPNQTGKVDDFVESFPAHVHGTSGQRNIGSDRLLHKHIDKISVLFQLTDTEISTGSGQMLLPIIDSTEFDSGWVKSFVFVVAELKGKTYPRGKYATITREINRRFNQPVVIVFGTSNNLVSLAFVYRREHKRDSSRDVLGHVSLVREIDTSKPRVHLEILTDLSIAECIDWIHIHRRPLNFDGLFAAWLEKLNTELLSKRFYKDLYAWFLYAIEETKDPTDQFDSQSKADRIIRLITRLLFIWFIKEKGLVSEKLFIEEQIAKLIKGYQRDTGDAYYRVVLRNLFFATLNTEISKRGFTSEDSVARDSPSLYQYQAEMSDPTALNTLFSQSPFINGGLFDSRVHIKLTGNNESRVSGVLREVTNLKPTEQSKLFFPNYLFFGEKGLFPLLNNYKFTVEESTPIEQEVALDPELLGKVFENLLAAYNPETKEQLRKQTGSFYTPRQVVDYMVSEALVATLAEKTSPDKDIHDKWKRRLRCLFDFADSFEIDDFSDSEKEKVVRAIARLKILDPAVGSGAFPMGVLQKLTLVLRRLDSNNELWQRLQKDLASEKASQAFDTQSQKERQSELLEISNTFERYSGDFGRKLYLIQNSIFGVDIQSVACQIAKLRFFISLAVEQERNPEEYNFGIKPLPNLETRFLAANSLIAIDDTKQRMFEHHFESTIIKLKTNREKHFHATSNQKKMECKNEDKILRQNLSKKLHSIGLPDEYVQKIAEWDPYNQNSVAEWFDSEYMFGIVDGFDIVIGNPPYINVEKLSEQFRRYLFANFQTCTGRTDIYIAFIEKSLALLNSKGLMTFIVPDAFLYQNYAKEVRKLIIEDYSLLQLVDASSYRIFESAAVDNIILFISKPKRNISTEIRNHNCNQDFEERAGSQFYVNQDTFKSNDHFRFDTQEPEPIRAEIRSKITKNSHCLGQLCLVAYGARVNHRDPSKKLYKKHYVSSNYVNHGKKFVEGKNIERYRFSQHGWLNYKPNEHYNPMFPELFEREKLITINVVTDDNPIRFAYDNEEFYNSHTVINCVRIDLLAGVRHNSVALAAKENIGISSQFDYKFLLAILNSRCVCWYFHNFFSDGTHLYPNDVKQLPIPKISPEEQSVYIRLADEILSAKSVDETADTSEFEREIDQLIFQFYKFTSEEIEFIEHR